MANANGFPVQTYRPTLEALLGHFHVLSFLARPWWGTTPSTWLRTWDQMAEDLVGGLEGMGFKGGVGIGHSLGGVLTLYAAVRRPGLFSKIVLIDPTMVPPKLLWQIRIFRLFGFDARSYLVKGALRRKTHWGSTEEAFTYFRGRQLFRNWSDGMVRAYTENITGPDPQGGVRLIYPPEWEARIYRTIPTDIWKKAASLRIPVLVVRGETSNTFTAASERKFRKVLPTALFQVVPGAGHLVAQEKPLETGKLIAEWLKGQA